MKPKTPAQQLLYTTVKLTTRKNGRPTGSGTGFFYEVPLNDSGAKCVAIITNKHVVEDADEVVAYCHVGKEEPTGEIIECVLQIRDQSLAHHPDASVDLCGLSFSDIINNASRAGKPPYLVKLTKENIPKAEDWDHFDAIEELTMIGCPSGLFDKVNCLPLVRRGITATPLSARYNGRNEFMVDMACFPGSSGSPVFVYNPSGYLDLKTNTFRVGAARMALVGILYSGPLVTNEGQIVMNRRPSVAVDTMMHLGFVVRSSELLRIEARFRELAGPELRRRGS